MNSTIREILAYARGRPSMFVGACDGAGLRVVINDVIEECLATRGSRVARVNLHVDDDGCIRLEFEGVVAGLKQIRSDDLIEFPGKIGILAAIALSASLEIDVSQQDHCWRRQRSLLAAAISGGRTGGRWSVNRIYEDSLRSREVFGRADDLRRFPRGFSPALRTDAGTRTLQSRHTIHCNR